jgi:hypothetical protein
MGKVTLLRTLTQKSILGLGFGDYNNLRVEQILDLGKGSYLRWVYYNFDKMNFTEDILIEIGIAQEHRIPKPGKNPSLLKTADRANYGNLTDEDKTEIKQRVSEKKYQKMKKLKEAEKKENRKGNLKAMNNGYKNN